MTAIALFLGGACSFGPTSRPEGVIVISIDTLRPDYTEPYGAAPGSTPNLARFAEDAVVFEHAYAAANETLFSHGALFTALLPSDVGPLNYDWTIPDEVPTLAEAFRDGGFKTAAVVAGGHLSRIFGLDDGFEDYVESERWGSFHQTVPMAVRWLEQRQSNNEPFFLFLHSYDCHSPYTKPGPFRRMALPGYDGPLLQQFFQIRFYEQIYRGVWYPDFAVSPIQTAKGREVLDPASYAGLAVWAESHTGVPLTADDQTFLTGSYAAGVLYADLWLGVFLDELERLGLDDTTTLVVLSDHGEGLLDLEFINHRQTLHDPATHVPLLVRKPGLTARRVADVVSLMDVAPTLLGVAGLPGLPGARGQSLEGCFEGEACGRAVAPSEGVLNQVSGTDGHTRLIVKGRPANDPGLNKALVGMDPSLTETWTGAPTAAEQLRIREGLALARAPR